jgi:hypothetical protein
VELTIRIDTRGALLAGKAPEVVQQGLDRVIAAATLLLHAEVVKRTPQGVFGAQGGLLASIQNQVPGRGTPAVKGIVSTASKYGEVIEKGRTAGKGMPPQGTLLRWIEVKFGVDSRTAQRIEFVVRRKIGQKGFDGAHMFEHALQQNIARVEALFIKEGFAIARELTHE